MLKRLREILKKRRNKKAIAVVCIAITVLFAVFALLVAMHIGAKTPPKKFRISSVTYRDASKALGHATWSSYFDTMYAAGACITDINNDDLQDLFFPGLGDFNTNLKFLPEYRLGNTLYLNRGLDSSGTPIFHDVTDEAGVRNVGKMGVGCAVADYDNNGTEDIVVTNATRGVSFSSYGIWIPGEPHTFPPPDFFHTDKTDGKYNFPAEGGVTLFLNEGVDEHGVPHFRDATIEAKLTRGGNGTSAAWADVNADGLLDLFVANYSDLDFLGFTEPHFAGQYNVLWRNNGNGTFSDVSPDSGVQGEPEFVYTPDGKKQYGWSADVLDSLGRTVGDPAGNTLAAVFLDYNDDGLPDLVTGDDIPGRIRLYENHGNFRFQQVSDTNDFGIAGLWMGIAIGDVDSDGIEDIFATNAGAPNSLLSRGFERLNVPVMGNILRPPSRATHYNGLWLYRDGAFHNFSRNTKVNWGVWKPDIGWFFPPEQLISDESQTMPRKPYGFEEGEFGFGAAIFDYDNDGRQDIAWVGSLQQSASYANRENSGNPGRLLKNEGMGERFADVGHETGFFNLSDKEDRTSFQNGRGLAIGDFNNDGYYDAVITNAGGWDSGDRRVPRLPGVGLQYRLLYFVKKYQPGPTFLYISDAGSNNWLKVKLVGVKSNRSAIGAKVWISYFEDGIMKKQVREVRAGESFASQNSLELIFGLGSATEADELTVRWPYAAEKNLRVLRNIKANQRLVIKEIIP